MNTITIISDDIQSIEEKASDLVGTIASIRTLAISNPESVGSLLASLEMAMQSVQADLYELRSTLGHTPSILQRPTDPKR